MSSQGIVIAKESPEWDSKKKKEKEKEQTVSEVIKRRWRAARSSHAPHWIIVRKPYE